MTGQAHWLPFVFLLLAASPVLAFWISDALANRRYVVQSCNVRCRLKGNLLAKCTVVRDAKSGAPIGIRNCSVTQPDPSVVRCARPCLPLFAHKAA